MAPGATWTCPDCGHGWRPDGDAVARVASGVRDLARLRRQIGLAVAATLVIAAVLVALHPAWILGAPLLLGGMMLALQPTYRRRRDRALAQVRTSIRLSRL